MNLCKCSCGLMCQKEYRFRHEPKNLCKCECGQLCTNNFIRGHGTKGISPWNKGKTKEIDSRIAEMGKNIGRALTGSHPRKIICAEEDKKSWPNVCSCECGQKCRKKFVHGHNKSQKGRKGWNKGLKQTGEFVAKRMAHSGWKKFPYISSDGQIQIKMRSNWEVLYANYLYFQDIKWLYEPKGFKLSNGHRYFPDFYLPELNEFHEVKGWIRPEAQIKMDLFQKEYLGETLVVIGKDFIDRIKGNNNKINDD